MFKFVFKMLGIKNKSRNIFMVLNFSVLCVKFREKIEKE